MARLDDNLAILERLRAYLLANPDQRFGQALRNLGVVDEVHSADGPPWRDGFNEEPSGTLHRMAGRPGRPTCGPGTHR